MLDRMTWHRKQADEHASLGNKLTNVARRMIAITDQLDPTKKAINAELNLRTMERYSTQASKLASKKELSAVQIDQIKKEAEDINRKTKAQDHRINRTNEKLDAQENVDRIQKAGQEFDEMNAVILTCNVHNTLHYPKIKRIADAT